MSVDFSEVKSENPTLSQVIGGLNLSQSGIKIIIDTPEIAALRSRKYRKTVPCNGKTDLGYFLVGRAEDFNVKWRCLGDNEILIYR